MNITQTRVLLDLSATATAAAAKTRQEAQKVTTRKNFPQGKTPLLPKEGCRFGGVVLS